MGKSSDGLGELVSDKLDQGADVSLTFWLKQSGLHARHTHRLPLKRGRYSLCRKAGCVLYSFKVPYHRLTVCCC